MDETTRIIAEYMMARNPAPTAYARVLMARAAIEPNPRVADLLRCAAHCRDNRSGRDTVASCFGHALVLLSEGPVTK